MAETAGIIVLFMPLYFVMFVANTAEARRTRAEPYQGLAMLAYIALALLYAVGVLAGLALQVSGPLLQQQPDLLQLFGGPDSSLAPESFAMLGLGLWLPSLLGIVLLLPPVRRAVSRVTALDPASPVHAVALSMTMLIVINLLVTLGFGLGNLTTMMEMQNETTINANGALVMLWTQQILMVLLAIVGVGWLTRRTFSQALQRLGISSVSGRQIWLALGLALLMIPIVVLIEYVGSLVGFGASPDVEALSEELFGPLFRSPFGILTIGLAAALGEEPLFRGAAQPRFGLIPTALLFALVHSNYGVTISTLVVFVLGLVLGWLRIRHNTTTAMVMHAAYNITLALIAYLGVTYMEF